MGRNSGGIRNSERAKRSDKDYYMESKRLRAEALQIAEQYKGSPLHFTVTKGFQMNVEVTKSDIKTIVSKNTGGDKFNAIKNAIAKDIKGYVEKATYWGWRETIPGKHPESAYFVYFNRNLGERTYLCVRKMKSGGIYKPYAIIDRRTFIAEVGYLHKGKPPQ